MGAMRNPVGWFEIYVEDMGRARAFYEAVFQRSLAPLPAPPGPDMEMLVFPGDTTGAGCIGALVKSGMRGPSPDGALIYFSCDDCAQEAARAAQHGGAVRLPKTAIGDYGFIALVSDSEGNCIGLHSGP
jgi:predicted enzyme related to lactoylglutathione lyase